jgi:phenylalanyl-tRNA synthetase beta chain
MNWLKDFVNITKSPEELAEILVARGFEIEEIRYLNQSIINVFTCKIIEIKKHPTNEKLAICKIVLNSDQTYQIVTNDHTLRVGDIVAVAINEARLPSGMVIKTTEFDSVISQGMFCSAEMLGIKEDDHIEASADKILKFHDEEEVGANINDIFGLNDVVLDIGITANRPDANSIIGIAKEIAAALRIDMRRLPHKYPDASGHISNHITLDNQAPDLCPRYIARVIKNVKIKKSPKLVRDRLRAVGIRPINNIVDITNYVLIEVGQPMHAFDLERVGGNIVVRRAQDGEILKALDGRTYTLRDNHLVIANKSVPMAIAGVMGGENFSINSKTKDIVFESASFARDSVRQTSKELGLRSDSSARFEKGIDAYSQEVGMSRALALICKFRIGDIIYGVLDTLPTPPIQRQIEFTLSDISDILGIKLTNNEVVNILKSFDFVTRIKKGVLQTKVPLSRDDVSNVNDLAEEIIRGYGYDKLRPDPIDKTNINTGGTDPKFKALDKIKSILVAKGCYEILTYSFTSPKIFDILNIPQKDSLRNVIKIQNPLGEDFSVMRSTLVYGMIKAISTNFQRGNRDLRLFEVAKVYAPAPTLDEYPFETNHLILGSTKDEFYSFKAIIQEVFDIFNVPINFKRSAIPYMHPWRCSEISTEDGDKIGVFGELSLDIANKFNITKRLYLCEIDPECMVSKKNTLIYQPISKYPAIERDFAVVVDKDVEAESILKIVRSRGGEFLTKTYVFDVYTGDQIGEGKKSIAFNMVFQSTDRTLTDDEISKITNNILEGLKTISAVLR